jgi:hypothetical protein
MDQYLVCSPDFAAALKGVREPEDLADLAFVANGSLPSRTCCASLTPSEVG